MILADVGLPSKANQRFEYSGMDCVFDCVDLQHFLQWPWPIDYQYNSRGFRDQEWPDKADQLKQAIWCIGDSFTVGLGSPLLHTWPQCLQTITGQRVINVSMDGASNEWIVRQAQSIVHGVDPCNMIIMWSYTHRREKPDVNLSDEDRRIWHKAELDPEQDWQNFLSCKHQLDSVIQACQFSVPKFHWNFFDVAGCWNSICGPDWPECPLTRHDYDLLPKWIRDEIHELHGVRESLEQTLNLGVIPVAALDRARDGYHFDKLTSQWVAQHAMQYLR